MKSLLDRPSRQRRVTTALCRWHAAKLWQSKRAKLLKLNLICIISCTTSKKRTKIWIIDFLNFLNLKKLEFSWKEDSSVPIGWSVRKFVNSVSS